MGHIRLGRLPKTRKWGEVVTLLSEEPDDIAGIAAAVLTAGEGRLRQLSSDPSLTYCFWLLTRIAWASRGASFEQDLGELGIAIPSNGSVLGLISAIGDRVREETSGGAESGHFGELASLALRKTLVETVGQQGPGLFGSSIEDLRSAFRSQARDEQFGRMSRRFFGDFLARVLRAAIDRELTNHVGHGRAFASIEQGGEFSRALDLYAHQSGRIVEDFASGWYGKHNWQSKGEVTVAEAEAFVAVALRKLRMELKLAAAPA